MTTVATKERSIIFTGESVLAILDGRKTQTRRVCRDQEGVQYWKYLLDSITWPEYWKGKKGKPYTGWVVKYDNIELLLPRDCPYGVPGDELWVRETWRPAWASGTGLSGPGIRYRSDNKVLGRIESPCGGVEDDTWKSPIFMPRWASRILLEVTAVRVERLKDISEEDAKAEGTTPSIVGDDLDHLRYRAGFQTLWHSINAERGFAWDTNPFVWVVDFRKSQKA